METSAKNINNYFNKDGYLVSAFKTDEVLYLNPQREILIKSVIQLWLYFFVTFLLMFRVFTYFMPFVWLVLFKAYYILARVWKLSGYSLLLLHVASVIGLALLFGISRIPLAVLGLI